MTDSILYLNYYGQLQLLALAEEFTVISNHVRL